MHTQVNLSVGSLVLIFIGYLHILQWKTGTDSFRKGKRLM